MQPLSLAYTAVWMRDSKGHLVVAKRHYRLKKRRQRHAHIIVSHELNHKLLVLECQKSIILSQLVTNFNAAISSSFAANTLRKAPVFSHAPCYLMSEAFDNPDSATRIGMSWMVEPLLSQDGWTEEKILDWQGYTVPLAPTPLQKDVHAFLHFAYDLSSHTGVHNCVVPGDVQGRLFFHWWYTVS